MDFLVTIEIVMLMVAINLKVLLMVTPSIVIRFNDAKYTSYRSIDAIKNCIHEKHANVNAKGFPGKKPPFV